MGGRRVFRRSALPTTYLHDPGGSRTRDLRIKSPLLYQLSYRVGNESNFASLNDLDNSLRGTHSATSRPIVPVGALLRRKHTRRALRVNVQRRQLRYAFGKISGSSDRIASIDRLGLVSGQPHRN